MQPRFFVKVFADGAPFDPKALIPVFHRFIQEKRLDELLIDVTDYSHVHHGPGVMLIAYEAHYGFDEGDGRPGLRYERKRGGSGSEAERLTDALQRTLDACRWLEDEPSLGGRLRFRTDELLLGVNDRLIAPNTSATFAALSPAVQEVVDRLYGDGACTLEHLSSPRAPFSIRAKATTSPGIAALRSRL